MPALLVLVLVVVPLLELVVIIQVGQIIGTAWTVTLLVADSVLGAILLRHEGRRAWEQLRVALAEGRWPGDEVLQGALVIVGGALLLTPGFLTDVVGFLLLLVPTRALLSRWLRSRAVPAGFGERRARGRRGPGDDGRDGADGLGIEVVEIRRADEELGPSGPGRTADPPGEEPDDEDAGGAGPGR